MRKFVWRLQRVLDIRKSQERKARSELFTLTQKLAAARAELLIQKKIMENIIKELAGNNPRNRLAGQEFFMKNCAANNEKIKKLKENIHNLELQQKEKINEVLQLRKTEEGMEKLRARAKEEYIKEQEKIEQKELDEESGILFVRNNFQEV
jgi:flagellar biosynthesis chaperone FliJ